MKKIGILTAMKEEADIIIKKYNLEFSLSSWNMKFYENDNIVLCHSWIWKIQAAIATTSLIQTFSPTTLINIGIAGNTNTKKINIGDVVLVNACSQHDIYLPFPGNHNDYLKAPIFIESISTEGKKFDFWVIENGKCITGDQFIDNQSKVKMLSQIHRADCIEMEAFAFLSAAREFDKLDDCVVIKWISDWADSHTKTDHEDNLELAMNNSVTILDLVIQSHK